MSKRGAPPAKKRPVMRHPGGKFKLTSWILSYFPPHKLYVELYGGAASVLMAKTPSQGEVYNEIDDSIVNVFRVLRDPEKSSELERQINLTPFSYKEYINSYSAKSTNDVERARLTIFRSFAGLGSDSVFRNAGFRGLKNKETSVTSAQEWSRYGQVIKTFTTRLKNVVIESRDATEIIPIYDRPDAFFYADPPYPFSTRGKNRMYQHEMTDEDHVKLAEMLNGISGNAIVSSYRSDLYDELYKGWLRIDKNATAQNGTARVESIWVSPNIQPRLF